MSRSLTAEQPMIRSREHQKGPESAAARGLSQRPLIDTIPTSPAVYYDENSQSPIATMLPTQSSANSAPALPEKSARRASRMLDGIISHKLPTEDQQPPLSTQSAPHAVYLSSEEDASSSADDFSDFECDSSSEESRESSIRRGSQEDTARVVSVIFSGKPSIVDLPRRSMSPSSSSTVSETSSRPPSRLRRTSTMPVIDHRRASICVSSSASIKSSSSILHPPRTSSMLPSSRLVKQKPLFLNIDPFAKPEEPEEEPKRPKTPTGVFKRTLSLVRKRSRPTLNTHYSSLSRDNLSNMLSPHHMERVREESTPEPAPAPKTAPALAPAPAPAPAPARPVSSRGPVTYHEIVNSAKRRAQTTPISPISPMSEPPASPMTPNGGSTRHRLRFSSARRRSIKA